MAQKIVAFIAKSFASADEAKIAPITKFLESFGNLGFVVDSAEQSEVESVSKKVREKIDKSDVLVGIFTKRHPIYRFEGRFSTAISALRGQLTPTVWSAPPWVLQESGYALRANKSLILFREDDVEIPGLQGDLEYIPFDPRNPTPALQRASEMITSLIAKAGSIRVETVVESEPMEASGSDAGAPPKPPDTKTTEVENTQDGSDLTTHLYALFKATEEKDWGEAEKQFEEGLSRIRANRPDRELLWKCLYQKAQFDGGRQGALAILRELAAENPDQHIPLELLADCLVSLREYEEALRGYQAAALLEEDERRARLDLKIVVVLKKQKRFTEARDILLRLRRADYGSGPEIHFEILRHLYFLAKELDDSFSRFALAELALRERPEEVSFRFAVAYAYDEDNSNHLALYHYRIICDRDERYPSALNNLGVASFKTNLPVLAADRYKRAYEMGDTLSASNLAYRYSEAGLSQEAIALLKDAQSKEDCVPQVSAAMAAIHERIEDNKRGEDKVLAEAEEQRNFLLKFGEGLLSPMASNLDGPWSFPLGTIDLALSGSNLIGAKEKRDQVNPNSGMSSLFPGSAPKSVTRIERFSFSGTISGRTCKFKLITDIHDEPASWTFGTPTESTDEGYIIFAESGKDAQVVELKDGKPEKYYPIARL